MTNAIEMEIMKLAAFADGSQGGNPAGVVLLEDLPNAAVMQATAAEVGFSETAFAAPLDEAMGWRVRYFSPSSEVPFCGHATIALGAALASRHGDGRFALELNQASITVDAAQRDGEYIAALQSPATFSKPLDADLLAELLDLCGISEHDLDTALPPGHIHAGADHAALFLRERHTLAAVSYDLERGRALMNRAGLVTVLLGYIKAPSHFHVRNLFASGGVYEDPATGAAAAALAGYLRDRKWPVDGAENGSRTNTNIAAGAEGSRNVNPDAEHELRHLDIVQGEDMGSRSLLAAEYTPEPGSSVRVSGSVRWLS